MKSSSENLNFQFIYTAFRSQWSSRGLWKGLLFPGGSVVKDTAAMQKTQVQSLGLEDPMENGMATHSSILAWRIPRTEEPGGLQSVGLQRIRHD